MMLEKAKNPAFWEMVRTSPAYDSLRKELLTFWEENCTEPLPAEKYSLFISYSVTGSRTEYQKPLFIRRRGLCASAVLSLIYPDNETYFTTLCDFIWAILEEYVWVTPAHMPSFTENVVHHIDLYAAETAAALSEIDYIFGDRLPPLIRSRIRAEVQRRIFDGYLGETRYGWESNTANWAPVCLCGVVSSVLYLCPDRLPEILPRIDKTLRGYLSGFAPDGICLEGFGYWTYGFGHYTVLADLLRDFSDGKIDYFALPSIPRIAGFSRRMYLDGRTTVSFSDGGMRGKYQLGLLHYLKREFPDAVQIPDRSLSYAAENHGRFQLYLRAFLWFDEHAETAPLEEEYTDYAPDSQWLIRRTSRYGFAAKGGHNKEPHNHNDLGSFILTAGGEQILTDPGAGTYDSSYFTKDRYKSFKACSRGHSVPIVDGQHQMPGREHCSESSYENGIFTLELHRAYGVEVLTELRRSFSFAGDSVTLTDHFTLTEERPLTERFISRKPAEIRDGCVVTGPLTLTASADAEIAIHEEQGLSCIDYILAPGTRDFTLEIQIG